MGCGCLVVGCRTAPVQRAIRDGVNGLLVDCFAPDAIAAAVVHALSDPAAVAPLRAAAQRTVEERYDLHGVCLPQQIALADAVAAGRRPTMDAAAAEHPPRPAPPPVLAAEAASG